MLSSSAAVTDSVVEDSAVKDKGQRALLLVTFLYVPAALFSLLLTIYTIVQWRVALPSYDLVDHHAFLASAAQGVMDWQGLWERHNGVHLIVLPKLVFWLDMRWLAGQGWLVTAASALAIVATLRILLQQVSRIASFSRVERRAFGALVTLLLSSVLLCESLLNPIDIQWSLLALGTVWFASLLVDSDGWYTLRVIKLLLALLLVWLSGGPLVLLLLATAITLLLTSGHNPLNRWLTSLSAVSLLLCALLLIAAWEWHALQHGGNVLLMQLYRPFTPPEQWASGNAYLHEHPAFYVSWLSSAAVFMARFALLPLGYGEIPVAVPVTVFCVWLMAVWRSLRHWQAGLRFFVFLMIFGLLLGFGAGVVRVFTQYNFRHANMGFLLLAGSLVVLYGSCAWRYRAWLLSVFLLAYGVVFMRVVVVEAGSWAQEGRNVTATLQIGDALGVRDPAKFAPVWKDDSAHREAVERSRTVFRQQRSGIYGSSGYRYFLGENALPAVEKHCDYRLTGLVKNSLDTRAYTVSGTARTAEGQYLTRALFVVNGANVGWAETWMPSAILASQWREPWQWGGYMVLDGFLPPAVHVVAFNGQQRCQPWPLPN